MLAQVIAGGAAGQALTGRRAALEIEVADMDSAGRLCMRHAGAPPAPNTRVWLVQADTPQSVARAAPASGRCASRPERPEGAGVRLVPLRVLGGTLDSTRLSIAIVAPAREPVVLSGVATADLDGDGVAERFRACTSSEGVHLTVWSGPPGRARLRWHRYFYLGYDVEPDCPESDIHDPAPGAALGRPSLPTGQ